VVRGEEVVKFCFPGALGNSSFTSETLTAKEARE